MLIVFYCFILPSKMFERRGVIQTYGRHRHRVICDDSVLWGMQDMENSLNDDSGVKVKKSQRKLYAYND